MKKPSSFEATLNERVDKIFEEHLSTNSTFLDVPTLTTKLRTQYQEYGRRPFKPFQFQVERAIQIMLKKIEREEADSSDEIMGDANNSDGNQSENESDDVHIIKENIQQNQLQSSSNSMNLYLQNSYKKSAPTINPNGNNTFTPIPIPITTTPTTSTTTNITPPNLSTPSTPINSASKSIKRTRESNQSIVSTNENGDMIQSSQSTPKQTLKKYKKDLNNGNSQQQQQQQNTGLIPLVNFNNLGGIENVLKEIREHIQYPISYPEIYNFLGVDPPRGILLQGPPGCGKTLLAKAIAGELQVPLISISGPEITSGVSGESEAKIRTLFSDAQVQSPCLIFIDEIDAIAPKRETASKDMERRIVAQLLTCMDGLISPAGINPNNNNMAGVIQNQIISEIENSTITTTPTPANNSTVKKGHVLVIAATNRVESLDTALRSRFDKEICLGVPDQNARSSILKIITSRMRLEPSFDYEEIARITPGYVGSDLTLLARESSIYSINRFFESEILQSKSTENINEEDKTNSMSDKKNQINIFEYLKSQQQTALTTEQMSRFYIEMSDFKRAVKKVQPSAKREGFATIPDITWEDIGALSQVREELANTILSPIKFGDCYKKMGVQSPAGVLLYGPPGCGKTLLAKAIANECQANFISVKGPELLNKYVGESERAVRQVFQRAQASSPCIIFFDEFDSLVPKRGMGDGSQASDRVVNQLLTEMDGLEKRSEVFIIAATNRPDIIDQAILRPGRLDKLVFVPLPNPDERVDILKTITSKIPLHESVNFDIIGKDNKCDSYSGADLALLVKEAASHAISVSFKSQSISVLSNEIHKNIKVDPITMDDFQFALSKVKPSVSRQDEIMYNKLRSTIKQSRKQPENNNNNTNNTNSNNEGTKVNNDDKMNIQ